MRNKNNMQKLKAGKDYIGVGFGVMMMKDGKILLGKRHEDPEKADSELNGMSTWTMPGGKMDFGETFEGIAIREVLEETNIKVKKIEVICVNNERMDGVHFVTIGMFSDDFEGEAEVMEPDEITEWRWFGLDELPRPLFFPSEKVIENYKQKKFYIPENELINEHK
jgi:ADP-ribose pyrophosphatase YjhB (NUDIX family)